MYQAARNWQAYGFGGEEEDGSGRLELASVALDTEGCIWSLDRAGRSWADREAREKLKYPVLRRWCAEGKVLEELGANLFTMPHGLTLTPDGGFLVTDVGLHQVLKLSRRGMVEWSLGKEGKAGCDSSSFNLPTSVAIGQDEHLFVADGYKNARVVRYTPDGVYDGEWGTPGLRPGQFNLPHCVQCDDEGRIYIADRENSRVQVFDSDGAFLRIIDGPAVGKPFGLHIHKGSLFIADCGFPQSSEASISVVNLLTGASFCFAHSKGCTDKVVAPHDIAVGEDGSIYIADVVLGLLKFEITKDNRR